MEETHEANALIEQLEYGDDEERMAAVSALTEIGELAIPALIEALGSLVWDACDGAAEALAEIGEPAVPVLIEALGDERHISINAADALARMGEPAVPALIGASRDTYQSVREHAIRCIG